VFCRIEFYEKASQTLKIYKTDGFEIQRRKCDSSWTENYIQITNFVGQKESSIKHLYFIRSNHKGYSYAYLGTVIEVNVSELGLVTQTGKVVWSKYAQVTNNP